MIYFNSNLIRFDFGIELNLSQIERRARKGDAVAAEAERLNQAGMAGWGVHTLLLACHDGDGIALDMEGVREEEVIGRPLPAWRSGHTVSTADIAFQKSKPTTQTQTNTNDNPQNIYQK